ncbi:hypothetical protein NXH76_17290 [Blautia schinkii]|nr:hypothetical protein [Blautia schinkii]
MNDIDIKNAALRELLEIFDSENDLDEEEFKEYEAVRDEAARIIEYDEDAQELFNQAGISIDELACQIVKNNTDEFSGVGRLIDLAVRTMKAQGSDQESIQKCIDSLCDQCCVPDDRKREFKRLVER